MPGIRGAAGLALIAGLGAIAMAAPAAAQSCHGAPTGVRVSLTVQGIRSDKGNVAAVIFGDNEKRYLKPNGELETVHDPAVAGTMTLCFWLPKAGDYALFVFHDANANGEVDTGLLGIPKEGFGFSNNVRPKLSAPSFKSTHFTAGPGDTSLAVMLHYR